jgi:hypothetical protein
MGAGMKLQTHHIIYGKGEEDDADYVQEWTVDLPWFLHRPMNVMTRWKPTHERYAILVNYWHAISFEINRMRRELDQAEINEG